MLQVPKAKTTKCSTPCHRVFFYSNAASPKDMTTTRSWALCCHFFFLLWSFKHMMTMSPSCFFLFQSFKWTNMRSLAPPHCVFLFRWFKPTTTKSSTLYHCVFFLFWSLKFNGCFICFLMLVKNFVLFCFVVFVPLVDAKSKKNKDC